MTKEVFVNPSAAGSSSTIGRDGVVMPGKAHEAKEGKVTNPGVRTLASQANEPVCPSCKSRGTLKMRMNKKTGQRIACSNCGYDPNKGLGESGVVTGGGSTKIVDLHGEGKVRGVRIIRGRGISG